MVPTSLLVVSLITLVCAGSVAENLVVHEQIDRAPNGFLHAGAASNSTVLNLRIALVSSNITGLEKALYDVSTPSSKLYGKHLSKAEVDTLTYFSSPHNAHYFQVEAFVAPKPETVSAVNNWLNANGLNATKISPAGDWLAMSLPVSKANDILGAEFSIFKEQATGKDSINTLSYAIPASLKGHIELVHPTIRHESIWRILDLKFTTRLASPQALRG
jgi:tripeptidyl-peptidase I